MLALAARSYARYVAPLTLLSLVLFAPVIAYAFFSKVPAELAPAWRMVMTAWTVAGTAWIVQYMLVGGAAPLVRSVVAGAPLSQLASLRASTRGLIRAVMPVLIVVGAVAIGSIALALPGLVLGVLLSLTGASTRGGLSEPLLESVEQVRANVKRTVIAVAAILVVDLAIVAIPFILLLGPLSPRPTPEELDTARRVLQFAAIGLPLVTPFAACVLAAIAALQDAPAQ